MKENSLGRDIAIYCASVVGLGFLLGTCFLGFWLALGFFPFIELTNVNFESIFGAWFCCGVGGTAMVVWKLIFGKADC